MSYITWKDSLSIGVDKIDDEHRHLIKLINAVVAIAKESGSKKEFVKAMSLLREYTVIHFDNEENYMESIEYPHLFEHSQDHKVLKSSVKDFQARLYREEKIEYKEVLDFLKDWLVGHLLGHDMKIKEYMEEMADSEPDVEEEDMDSESN